METAAANLQVTLSQASTAGEAGEVNLVFSVASDKEHRFCIYHTPLESFAGSILDVQDSDGAKVNYQGRVKKRSPPQDKHFVTVLPDAPQSATFNLARWYGVESGKTYSVMFKGSSHMNGLPNSNVLQVSVP